MIKKSQNRGFSLTEVLLAVATLAIGMMFIGGTFLVGIHFSTIATERTIAAVVADEAFAKVRLYGIDFTDPNLGVNQQARFELVSLIPDKQFPYNQLSYPSIDSLAEKQYYWSALCRPAHSDPTNRLVQVTVFVSRKVGSRATYPGGAVRPAAVQVGVSIIPGVGNENKLTINTPGEQRLINGGCTIADNQTGLLYRVVQRDADAPDTIILDKFWQSGSANSVWVVPPPVGGSKYPCIAVYQKVIRF
jgi:prepilin-type N-terminal cleavage/methylation domain-containing protein